MPRGRTTTCAHIIVIAGVSRGINLRWDAHCQLSRARMLHGRLSLPVSSIPNINLARVPRLLRISLPCLSDSVRISARIEGRCYCFNSQVIRVYKMIEVNEIERLSRGDFNYGFHMYLYVVTHRNDRYRCLERLNVTCVNSEHLIDRN